MYFDQYSFHEGSGQKIRSDLALQINFESLDCQFCSKMWPSKTNIIFFIILTFSSYTSAQCPYQFMPYNDSNCYFMKYHLVKYDDAKSICTSLNASMYVPDPGTDYQQIGYWIRQYTLVNPWIGIRQVMYNYTHALGQ